MSRISGESVPQFELRSRLRGRLEDVAARYSYRGDERLMTEVGPRARARGHLTRDEFLEVCEWKSPRTRPHCRANSGPMIEDVTRIALATANEQLRVEALTLLRGVNWPTASAILHFSHPDPYPILDFRALWSLGQTSPAPYTFAFWQAYTAACRGLAATYGVSMRTLDRALWEFSRTHQHRR